MYVGWLITKYVYLDLTLRRVKKVGHLETCIISTAALSPVSIDDSTSEKASHF